MFGCHAIHAAAPPAASAKTSAAVCVAVMNAATAASLIRWPLAPNARATSSACPGDSVTAVRSGSGSDGNLDPTVRL